MAGSWLSYVVHYVEPVKRSLFQSLTASEVSLVASLLGYRLTDREGERWLNPIRDMPEYEAWIRQMLREGHAVTLIGTDVSLLLGRINDPIDFWNHRGTEKLAIWLSVLDYHASMEWLSKHHRDHPQHLSTTVEEGETKDSIVQFQPGGHGERLTTMFLMPPGGLKDLARHPEIPDWYQSANSNKSNLNVLFFRSTHPFNSSSVACVKAFPSMVFKPRLVEEVESSSNAAGVSYVQTTFLNLNSSQQAYSARATIKSPPRLMLDRLRIALDVPHVITRNDLPMLIIPVSFHSTSMVSHGRSTAV